MKTDNIYCSTGNAKSYGSPLTGTHHWSYSGSTIKGMRSCHNGCGAEAHISDIPENHNRLIRMFKKSRTIRAWNGVSVKVQAGEGYFDAGFNLFDIRSIEEQS